MTSSQWHVNGSNRAKMVATKMERMYGMRAAAWADSIASPATSWECAKTFQVPLALPMKTTSTAANLNERSISLNSGGYHTRLTQQWHRTPLSALLR